MVQRPHYAHSLPDRPQIEWHLLETHLGETANQAARFGKPFGSAEWTRLAGLWHDLGKYLPEFQAKLTKGDEASNLASQQVDHSVVGALLAESRGLSASLSLAFAIAGHHGGLPNLLSSESDGTPLRNRLRERRPSLDRVDGVIPASIRNAPIPPLPAFLHPPGAVFNRETALRLEFWTRFLFSALVDADFLNTEEFFRPGARSGAVGVYDDIPSLRRKIDAAADALCTLTSDANRIRARVLELCREEAKRPTGTFSLTVPTGGGKTLSGMAFALRHAEVHDLRRVIVVIPYTSIIEQNAGTYRDALGANIIEHHSSIDSEAETGRNRLASENWDAPVVVTTSVQFFESLFANKPSRCRKLHNIARSVILLDEVQLLPSGFLQPILDAMRELTSHYGCTIILSTATQPALARRQGMEDGLVDVHEIVPRPEDLFRQLSRVDVTWPNVEAPPVAWPDLADELKDHSRVLAVVHRRDDARELARLLPTGDLFHLSALMCPKHRSDVLAEVKERLRVQQPCRLVSTQLVEAGVDVDFPSVYRALGGLDSIVQAAGRCNREGGPDKGRVVVFRAPTLPPRGTPTLGLETTETLLRQHGGSLDVNDPNVFTEYFRILYSKIEKDIQRIQTERAALEFANTAARFRIIEDGFTSAVVVPYEGSVERVDAARKELTRDTARALQPYLVNVYPKTLQQMEEAGALETIGDSIRVILPPFHECYDRTFGLVWGGRPGANIA